VATTAAAFTLRLFALLAAWQVDDLGADFGSQGLQFGLADPRSEHPEVCALHSDDGESRAACAAGGMASLAYEYLAHRTLHSDTHWRVVVILAHFGHLPKTIIQ
jgi:hypothetical protein